MGKVLKKKKRLPNETRILARLTPDGPLYRIAKIIGLKDGGFSLIPSMHIDAPGHVSKMPVDYSRIGLMTVPLQSIDRKFTARVPVKLSYHPSGFAQFSSAGGNVLSGLNDAGQIKGVGIYTNPLSQPIRTGPAAVMNVWGIDEFDIDPDMEKGAIVFDVANAECSRYGLGNKEAFCLNIFTIPKSFIKYARREDGKRVFYDMYEFENYRRALDLLVVELPCTKVFLGLWGLRSRVSFGASSGWSIGGPGKSMMRNEIGYSLNAIYPTPLDDATLKNMQLLEYGEDNYIEPDSDKPLNI